MLPLSQDFIFRNVFISEYIEWDFSQVISFTPWTSTGLYVAEASVVISISNLIPKLHSAYWTISTWCSTHISKQYAQNLTNHIPLPKSAPSTTSFTVMSGITVHPVIQAEMGVTWPPHSPTYPVNAYTLSFLFKFSSVTSPFCAPCCSLTLIVSLWNSRYCRSALNIFFMNHAFSDL